jgi:N-methylhydantoinase B
MNEGCFRPVEFRLPRGSLVNPTPPPAAGGRSIVMSAAIDAIIEALSAAQPHLAIAASGLLHSYAMAPVSSAGRRWLQMAYEYGGLGGRRGSDGPDATGIHFGLARNTIAQLEPIETRCPLVIESKEYIVDSGGPGRWRGGMGVRTVFRLLDDAVVTTRSDRMRYPPVGREGGSAGRAGRYLRVRPDGIEIELASKTSNHVFDRGDRFVVETSGGGGLGDPFTRDPDAVLRDLRDGRVTRGSVERDYRVAIDADADSDAVDVRATTALRGAGLRGERNG